MPKSVKKSLIVIYSILSAFLAYIPVVSAQGVTDIFAPMNQSLTLVFGIVQDIVKALLDSLQGNPVLAKGLLVIIMGIIFYSELKEVKALKNKSGAAGLISFLASISIAYWLPDTLTKNIFSATNPFIGFIFCCFILLLSKGDSNWSTFGKIISYLGLMISFAGLLSSISGSVPRIIVSGFTVASLVALIHSIGKLKGGTSGGDSGGGGGKKWYKPWTWGGGNPPNGNNPPDRGGNKPNPPGGGRNQPGGEGGTVGGQGGPSGGNGGNQPNRETSGLGGGNAPSKISQQDKDNHIRLLDRIIIDLNKLEKNPIARLNTNVGKENANMDQRSLALEACQEIITYVNQIEKYLTSWNDPNINSNMHTLKNILNNYIGFLSKLNDENKLRSEWKNLRDEGRTIKGLIVTLQKEITRLTNIVKNLP